ncbi:hypothetical protein F4804DRAFT_335418 [Jackrogersella minutella]|nr:hypothetical protein F4804DRAFT_335418 [Jackrogersella minutella]
MSVFSADYRKTGQVDFFGSNSRGYSKELSKISFPDPPRPPTPGPPPRPPPIPPRPPVPTPPPSPTSSAEAEWSQRLVAKQLSILAVRLVNIWSALERPISLPLPPRPPTPGPRPGPIPPRPDVPTPPPSPHRSAGKLICKALQHDDILESSSLGEALIRRLFYEHLAFASDVFVPLNLTTSPGDSHKREKLDLQNELYDDKLTNSSGSRGETIMHIHIYNVAPKDELDPHMSYLASCAVGESSSSSRTPHAGTGTFRNDPASSRVTLLRQLEKARADLFDASQGFSLSIAGPTTSGVQTSRRHQGPHGRKVHSIDRELHATGGLSKIDILAPLGTR